MVAEDRASILKLTFGVQMSIFCLGISFVRLQTAQTKIHVFYDSIKFILFLANFVEARDHVTSSRPMEESYGFFTSGPRHKKFLKISISFEPYLTYKWLTSLETSNCYIAVYSYNCDILAIQD